MLHATCILLIADDYGLAGNDHGGSGPTCWLEPSFQHCVNVSNMVNAMTC